MIRPAAIALLTVLALGHSAGQAQNIGEDPRVKDAIYLLERWIEAQREYKQIPGISVAIVHDQELVWSAGFGYADVESRRPARPDTVYTICSIAKLFTLPSP